MAKIIGRGKFLKLVRNGKWEFVERVNATGVVAIVAITSDRRIILTDQFRPAVGCQVIDLPAGLAGDIKGQQNESFANSARRELIEETGYDAKNLKQVANCPSSPGLTSEVVSLFVARGLRQVADGGGVEGEQIEVHSPPIRDIDKWLDTQTSKGKLIDAKVFAGLYFAKRRARAGKSNSRGKR